MSLASGTTQVTIAGSKVLMNRSELIRKPGRYLETKAKGKATQEIKKLLELGAKKARVLRGKKEFEIPIAEVKIENMQQKGGDKMKSKRTAAVNNKPTKKRGN